MFLFFAFGGTTVANNSDAALEANLTNKFGGIAQAPDTSVLLYVSLVFGFSLMVNVWIFFRVSGGLFNPAVSLNLSLFFSLAEVGFDGFNGGKGKRKKGCDMGNYKKLTKIIE